MYINYEYYRVFYYAAQCGNLTKAAALLQNSQPNLTRAIKTLEAELGCTLFSRTNRGLILTPEGEALYRHIRVAFAEIEAGEAAVSAEPDARARERVSRRERGRAALSAAAGAAGVPCAPSGRASAHQRTIPRRRPSPPCMRRRRISPWSRRPPRSRRR